MLPPAIGPIAETLAGHDLILVAGASVFAYYPYIPGDLLPEGAELVVVTSDPDEAARAPMGEAIVADVALTLRALLAELGDGEPGPRRTGAPRGADDRRRDGGRAGNADQRHRGDGGARLAPSPTTGSSSSRRRRRRSRSATSCASRVPAATTSAPAADSASASRPRSASRSREPDRPVVCVVGEGSAQYAITAFWSAVAYDVPVTFLVLRNSEYAILKWFSLAEGVENAPGLDLPALDVAAVAAGYGVPDPAGRERRASSRAPLSEQIGSGKAGLVEVGVAPGMWLA